MNNNNYNPDVLSCLANLSNDEVFTPPKLVNEILDLLPQNIWSDKNATFLDPVCKSGVFLREIAKRLMVGLEKTIPDKQKRIDHKAKKLNPRFLSMIIPARWFSGGKGLDGFREEMLNDNRIREIHDFPDASDLFPGVQIKGGVCYFKWERDNRGLCKVSSYNKGELISTMERPLLESGAETFIRYNEAISIIKKIAIKKEKSLKYQISSRKPFGFSTTYKGKKKPFRGSIELFQNGGVGYVSKKDLLGNNFDLVKKYKVFLPPLGSGSDSFPHPILGKPFIGKPNSACTETYIIAGSFDNKFKARNLTKYISTRFLRFLVLLNKPTQHATSKVYEFVPIQNFKEEWTDEKLYKKYGLSKDEIAFIELMVRPMEVENE